MKIRSVETYISHEREWTEEESVRVFVLLSKERTKGIPFFTACQNVVVQLGTDRSHLTIAQRVDRVLRDLWWNNRVTTTMLDDARPASCPGSCERPRRTS